MIILECTNPMQLSETQNVLTHLNGKDVQKWNLKKAGVCRRIWIPPEAGEKLLIISYHCMCKLALAQIMLQDKSIRAL